MRPSSARAFWLIGALAALAACAPPAVVEPPREPLAQADAIVRTAGSDPAVAVPAYLTLLAAADWALSPTDSAIVRRHLAQLAPLAPDLGLDGELATWPTGTGADALRWWRSRDPVPATAANERLPEHLARVIQAEAEYASTRHPSGLDGRGRVLLRLGPPEWVRKPFSLTLARDTDTFVRPEIWRYPSVGADAVFLFTGVSGFEEGTVREILPLELQYGSTYGPRGEARAGLVAAGLVDLLRPVFAFVPEYGRIWDGLVRYQEHQELATPGSIGSILPPDAFLADLTELERIEREFRQRRAETVPASVSLAGGHAPALALDVRTVRFREPDGTTRIDVVWALGPDALALSPIERATLSSLAGAERVTGLDVVVTAADDAFEPVAAWSERLAVAESASETERPPRAVSIRPAPAVAHVTLQVAALASETVARRAIVRTAGVPALAPTGFEASDLLPVRLPADQLAADPNDLTLGDYVPFGVAGGSVARDAPLAVVFEVYGLATDADGVARYTVEYGVTADGRRGGLAGLLGGRRQRRASSALTLTADGATTREAVAIDLSALTDRDDRVTVEVRVTDEATGATVVRTLPLTLAATDAASPGGSP
ncbi:GWxTD domain-containing protein [Rubrivirga sp.]|uniref:GWxTD domain-containing protein n=1 Tax=Rubrivirga sp. TaxID=1885344 RepID=UPI003B52DCB2